MGLVEARPLVAWSAARGQQVHGVPLIWCADEWTPQWVKAKAWTRDTMTAWIRDHVTTVMRRYAGRVQSWDIVNEAFKADGTTRDCLWSRVLGLDYVDVAFRAARAADPAAKLFYNEYQAEKPASRKFLATERLAKDLKARGVPLDGIGLQFHVFGFGPFQWQVEETFRRVDALGLEVHVTEMDVP